MLDAAAPGLTPPPADLGTPPESLATTEAITADHVVWDAALDGTLLEEAPTRLTSDSAPMVTTAGTTAIGAISDRDEPEALQAGLHQLNRYLARCWTRAGISPQQFEDCSQAVFATMLKQFGRDGFDQTLDEIGREGIPRVLNRETPRGPDFFRAVDMIKKRALRQRSHQALDDHQYDLAHPSSAHDDWSESLHEAINRSLNQREAELIQATLQGFSPSEIASQWGIAPKTVSNEKTRAFGKLRLALAQDLAD